MTFIPTLILKRNSLQKRTFEGNRNRILRYRYYFKNNISLYFTSGQYSSSTNNSNLSTAYLILSKYASFTSLLYPLAFLLISGSLLSVLRASIMAVTVH